MQWQRSTGVRVGWRPDPLDGARSVSPRPTALPFGVFACVYLLALYMGGVMKSALQDGDTYWHIAAGKWILEHGAIPRSDSFSHSMPGAAWTAHEWLSELILAGFHDIAGWTGVVAVTAAAFATAVALLGWALEPSLAPRKRVILCLVAVLLTLPHFLARPHILVMPLLMVWTIGLVRASDHGKAPPLLLTGLVVIWANMHGSFTLGLLLAFIFGAEGLIRARAEGRLLEAAGPWLRFVSLALLAGLVTPQGVHGYLFTWEVMVNSKFALAHIGEWASPNFHVFQPVLLWLLAAIALALHMGLRLPPFRLLLVLLFIYLSLKHVRYIEFLGLLVPLFVAKPISDQLGRKGAGQSTHRDAVPVIAQRLSNRIYAPLAVGLAVAGSVFIHQLAAIAPPEQIAPSKALAAARQAGVSGNVLNDYAWGGFLIYAGIPVFIDGRTDIYGDAFFKSHLEALDQRPPGSLEPLLEKHRITWSLLRPDTPALGVLDRLPQWRRVYADDVAVVHKRIEGGAAHAVASPNAGEGR